MKSTTKSILSKLSIGALCLLVLALMATPASAYTNTATTTMAVSATVQATCTVTAGAMSFGTYNTAVNNSTATITTTCTNTTPYQIGLDKGANGGSVTTRQMKNGAALLNYSLTQDAGHATNWGNTPGTDTPAAVNGNGSGQTVTVYGQIPAGQYVTPGSYSDTITVTVNY